MELPDVAHLEEIRKEALDAKVVAAKEEVLKKIEKTAANGKSEVSLSFDLPKEKMKELKAWVESHGYRARTMPSIGKWRPIDIRWGKKSCWAIF